MIVREILPLIRRYESVILIDEWCDFDVIAVQNQREDIDEIYHDLELQEIGVTEYNDIFLQVTTEFFGQIYSIEKTPAMKHLDEYQLSELAINVGNFEEEYYSKERKEKRLKELREEHPDLEFIGIG